MTRYQIHDGVLSPDRMLYFYHLPKTAGTSVIQYLDSLFEPDQIFPAQLWSQMFDMPDYRAQLHNPQYRLIRGHFGYTLLHLLPNNPVCFTMLRDPIPRTISNFAHITRDPNMYFHEFMTASQPTDLSEAVFNPRASLFFSNIQTRFLVSDFAYTLWGDDWDVYKVKPQDMLEIAKERLTHFEFVGITEQSEAAFELLNYRLGYVTDSTLETANVSPKSAQLSDFAPEVVERLHELNDLDMQLYAFARQLFQERYAAMQTEILQQLAERQDYHEVKAQLATLEARLAAHQHDLQRLQIIENSWGWRLILKLNAIRTALIPPDTRRERLYLKVRTLLLNRLQRPASHP